MTQERTAMQGGFPATRMRRLRYHPAVRNLVRDVTVSPSNLILPLFVRSGENLRQPIGAMPGHDQMTVDQLPAEGREIADLGIGGVILFGIPASKDAEGSDATSDSGIVAQAVRTLKEAVPELLVVTDVCFCEFTDHGHCGALSERAGRVDVDNDRTLDMLARQAMVHARAGADMVAPSGMIDGMIGAIRKGLDGAGYEQLPIMSYAAKYASGFYGPFREAAESAPKFGDRRSYQMDPASSVGQALREVELDLAEGADLVMVKPALAYLDVVHAVAESFPGVPLATYNVSGEYSMVKAAAQRGWINEQTVAMESLIAMRRAGAQIILSYWAKDVARWQKG
ncbi:MAG: porphobilinogen synthase [Thermoguttaceae bacterium]